MPVSQVSLATKPQLRHLPVNFWLLAVGQGISRVGDGVYDASLVWIAWLLTHQASAVAIVGLAGGLPAFALSLLGGSLGDRYSRRLIMVGCDSVRASLTCALPFLLRSGNLNLVNLAGAAAFMGVAGAAFAPARNALVPQVTPANARLLANAVGQMSFRAAYYAGPILLTPLIALLTLPGVFWFDSATFGISIVTIYLIRMCAAASHSLHPTSSFITDFHEGWQVIKKTPDVMVVIGTFVTALFLTSGFLSVALANMVSTQLHGTAGHYGLLLGIGGLAEMAAALILFRVKIRNLAITSLLAWLVLGVFRAPLGFVTSIPAAGILLTMTGLVSAAVEIPQNALMQARIPNQHLAKVSGLAEAGSAGAVALAPPFAAFVLSSIGIGGGFAFSGLSLMLVAGLAIVLARHFQAQMRAAIIQTRLRTGALFRQGSLATGRLPSTSSRSLAAPSPEIQTGGGASSVPPFTLIPGASRSSSPIPTRTQVINGTLSLVITLALLLCGLFLLLVQGGFVPQLLLPRKLPDIPTATPSVSTPHASLPEYILTLQTSEAMRNGCGMIPEANP